MVLTIVHTVRKLVQTTIKQFSNYRISILFSTLKNKNIVSILHQLLRIPKDHIYLTTFNNSNSIELVQKIFVSFSTNNYKSFCLARQIKGFFTTKPNSKLQRFIVN